MPGAAPSFLLQLEFQSLLEPADGDQQLRCNGVGKRGAKCRNRLSNGTKKKLNEVIPNILRILETGDEVEKQIHRLCSLILCKGQHQDQAPAKYQTWMQKIHDSKVEHSIEENTTELLPPSVDPAETTEDLTPILALSHKKKAETPTISPQTYAQPLERTSLQSISNSILKDDPGYKSDDEQEHSSEITIITTARTSVTSYSNQSTAPKTPKRSPLSVSKDSGISMSYDASSRVNVKQLVRIEDGQISPLADKATNENPASVVSIRQRPAPTPIQPTSSLVAEPSGLGPKTRSERKFVEFSRWSHWHNSNRMKAYMNTPFSLYSKENGYIYGFQIENCGHIKIGYSGKRKCGFTLEASLSERMKEHKNCGWPDLRIVLEEPVKYPQRIEKIIHYHLASARRKECGMQKGSNGRTCSHHGHTEWFDVSIERANQVVGAWKRWGEAKPFFESNGKIRLKSEWEDNLEKVDIESPGDHWLEWLDIYSPEKPAESTIGGRVKERNDIKLSNAKFLQRLETSKKS